MKDTVQKLPPAGPRGQEGPACLVYGSFKDADRMNYSGGVLTGDASPERHLHPPSSPSQMHQLCLPTGSSQERKEVSVHQRGSPKFKGCPGPPSLPITEAEMGIV